MARVWLRVGETRTGRFGAQERRDARTMGACEYREGCVWERVAFLAGESDERIERSIGSPSAEPTRRAMIRVRASCELAFFGRFGENNRAVLFSGTHAQ